MEAPLNSPLRPCAACEQEFPPVEYVVSDTETSEMCVSCRAADDEEAKALRRLYQIVRKSAQKIGKEALGAKTGGMRTMSEIAVDSMEKVGGLEAYTTLFAGLLHQVTSDEDTKPKEKLEWMMALHKMQELGNREVNERDTDSMSDEDIEKELRSLAGDVVENQILANLEQQLNEH